MLIWALAFLLARSWAQWATFYSFNSGKVYMLLKNNDIVPLNFSITGFNDLDKYSSYSQRQIDLQSGQQLAAIASPPKNSTVFLHKDTLYAFTASDQESDFDVCGDGVFQLLSYDMTSDNWGAAGDNITFQDVSDISYYEGSSVLTSPSSDFIYIYGGRCSSNGKATDRLLSFNMETFSFSNITTSTKPHGFYGAATQWAPNPQNSLVVGGRSNDGWLNMYQLATWNYDSGWSFQAVEKNDTFNVNSRVNPLLLPMFSPLTDNTTTTFSSNYRTSSLILIGGEGSKGAATPQWAQLKVDKNTWAWEPLESKVEVDQVLGAAVLYNTLVVIRGSSSSKKKRDSGYTVELYDVNDNFQQVKSLADNTAKSESSNGPSTTTTQKALIGTLVPVAAIAVVSAVGIFLWKRKNSNAPEHESVLDAFDYQLGHFRTRSDIPIDIPHPDYHPRLSTSSESTLEAASIDSWVKKRQEFDAKRQRTVRRHSILGSNETLSTDSPEEVNDEISENHDRPEMTQVHSRPAVPARVHQLRKSFSYTNTPPQSPNLKKAAQKGGYMGIPEPSKEEDRDDSSSCDEAMDVQVLVSSKRKSVLRVVNPDQQSQDSNSIRQRTPSE
ncbi:hypothetical protein CAJCM15448_31150 [Candidozyma auris]|nr:hypothetical protein CAJCM15448_31150 [[Candida] auris]